MHHIQPQTLKYILAGLFLMIAQSAYLATPEATVSRKPPHLSGDQTRLYSHIHWQGQYGSGIRVKLLPGVNATGKESYSVHGLSGKDHNTEVRTLPDNFDEIFFELTRNSRFLNPVKHQADFLMQFHIRRFDSLYNPGDRNHLANLGFAHLDRAWSQLHGDNKPATISLTLVLYDNNYIPLLEVPVVSQMMPCERSGNPMVFSALSDQQFLNGFATTTTGQAFIAAINRALEETTHYFAQRPITGRVLRVENNDVYINLGSSLLRKNETLELLYTDKEGIPPYSVSRLEVEETWDDLALVHALDIHTANVQAGDTVKLKKHSKRPKFVSVAGDPIVCNELQKKSEKKANTASTSEQSHWSWLSDD